MILEIIRISISTDGIGYLTGMNYLTTLIATIVANKLQTLTLHGREYIIAPVTMLVPGVLPGSDGPLYYPPEEVSVNVDTWNGIPIVLNHPQIDGQFVSARDPDILSQYGIGHIYRAVFNKKLTAKAYLDKERLQSLAPDILANLLNGKPIEVSTGLFLTNEEHEERVFNTSKGRTKPYKNTAKNYRPDHLAILTNDKGACAVDDGCGLNVNAEQVQCELVDGICVNCGGEGGKPGPCPEGEKKESEDLTKLTPAKLKKAHQKADETLTKELDTAWQRHGTDKKTTELVKLEGENSPLGRIVSRRNAIRHEMSRRGLTTNTEDNMDKDQLVNWIITNCSCFKGATPEEVTGLKAMSVERLTSIKTKAEKENTATTNMDDCPKGMDKELWSSFTSDQKERYKRYGSSIEANKETTTTVTANSDTTRSAGKGDNVPDEFTLNQWDRFLERNPSLKATFDVAKRVETSVKDQLIARLVSNVAEGERPAMVAILANKQIPELEQLVKLLPPVHSNQQEQGVQPYAPLLSLTGPVYSGAGGGTTVSANQQGAREDVLSLPKYDWAEMSRSWTKDTALTDVGTVGTSKK